MNKDLIIAGATIGALGGAVAYIAHPLCEYVGERIGKTEENDYSLKACGKAFLGGVTESLIAPTVGAAAGALFCLALDKTSK